MHNLYACRCVIDYLHYVVRADSFILQFFFFVLFEGAWPAVVADLAALVAYDVFINTTCTFVVSLIVVLQKCQLIVALYFPYLHWTGFGLLFHNQILCGCHRCWILIPSFRHIFFHLVSQAIVSAWRTLYENHCLHFLRHNFSYFFYLRGSCSIPCDDWTFFILSPDIIVPSSNQIPYSFCFFTCTLLKNFSRYLSGVLLYWNRLEL